MIILLFFLFLLPFPIHTLDSETNDPVYKFVIESGEPVTLNASDIIEVGNFDECIEKCEEDYECVMVYQSNSSDPCYLFKWNSILEVTRNESGGVGTVGFKVYTDQPSCDLNSQFLLNGKTYPIYPNDTSIYTWKIDTSETGWTITYKNQCQEEEVVCGNWGFDRPYPDSCNPECNKTLVQVWAKPGPLTDYAATTNFTVISWGQCMETCYQSGRCAYAHYEQGSNNCTMFHPASILFMDRTQAADGHHMVIKLPLNEKLCKMTTEQLLDDQYYVYAAAMYFKQKREYFRIRTTPKYYKVITYLDREKWYMEERGCPLNMAVSGWYNSNLNDTICIRHCQLPGFTQPEAESFCNEMDMFLLTDKYTCSMMGPRLKQNHFSLADLYTNFNKFPKHIGISGLKTIKSWYGLEKKDGVWKWRTPEFRIFNEDVMPIPWGPGEPKSDPDSTCAYMEWGDGQKDPIGYAFYASPCNSTQMDGFSCGSYTMFYQPVKTWDEVAAEFGFEQDCCLMGPLYHDMWTD